eukprot:gene41-58_t
MKNILLFTLSVLVLIGVYLSIKNGKKGTSFNPTEKTLYLASEAHIKTLDPIHVNDIYAYKELTKVYESLLEYHYLKRPIELVPNLAEEMPHISADKLVYTFKIKQGVKYHDNPCFPNGQGRELTAHDFVYSIKRIADPKLQSYNFGMIDQKILGMNEWRSKYINTNQTDYNDEIEGFKALDNYTLQLTLLQPDPQFLYVLAVWVLAIPHEAVTYYGVNFGNNPVGTGPFIMKKFKPQDTKFVYHKNPNFRHKEFPHEASEEFQHMLAYAGKKLPLVDKIVTYILPEESSKWFMFKKGSIDAIDISKNKITATIIHQNELIPELKEKNYQLFTAPQMSMSYFVFNNAHPLFKRNTHLRQAMSLAFDVKKYNELFYNHGAIIAQSTVPPGMLGYEKDYVGPYVGRDLEKAKRLLAHAGYAGGKGLPPITLDIGPDTLHRQRGEFFQKCMADLGIQVVIESHLFPELIKKIQTGQTMMHAVSWMATYPDAQIFFLSAYGPTKAGINSFFQDSKIDALYAKSTILEDSPEKERLYKKLKVQIAQKVPFICTLHVPYIAIYHSWLKNYCWSSFHYGTEQYFDIDLSKKKQLKDQL